MDDRTKDITRNVKVKRGAPKKTRTLGGDCECRWDESTRVAVNGHLAAFSQFPECGGLLERLVSGCPLAYTSHNAPSSRAVMASPVMPVANWWNVFTRLEEDGGGGHAEARGTRRSLQRTVCRIGTHAGRRTLELFTAEAGKCRCRLESIMPAVNKIRTAKRLGGTESGGGSCSCALSENTVP